LWAEDARESANDALRSEGELVLILLKGRGEEGGGGGDEREEGRVEIDSIGRTTRKEESGGRRDSRRETRGMEGET